MVYQIFRILVYGVLIILSILKFAIEPIVKFFKGKVFLDKSVVRWFMVLWTSFTLFIAIDHYIILSRDIISAFFVIILGFTTELFQVLIFYLYNRKNW